MWQGGPEWPSSSMDSMARFLHQEQYLAIFRCLNASGYGSMLKSDWNYLQEVLNDVLRTARRWAKCGNSEWFGIFWDSVFSHWWGRAIDQRVLAPWRMQGASRKMPVGSQSWANVGFQFRDHSSTASQQQSIGTEVPPSLSIPQA